MRHSQSKHSRKQKTKTMDSRQDVYATVCILFKTDTRCKLTVNSFFSTIPTFQVRHDDSLSRPKSQANPVFL